MHGPQRINKYIAARTGKSRRAVDLLIKNGQVKVNGSLPQMGQQVSDEDAIEVNGQPILGSQPKKQTILFNKPSGFVTSRVGQGNKTIYDILPPEQHHLKPVGRLDKNSSGLLLLSNDGELAHRLTHPSFIKEKIYEIELDRPLGEADQKKISITGVNIGDTRLSKLKLSAHQEPSGRYWKVSLSEGRNRQIRRTFDALGYRVVYLHRTSFGEYKLGNLASGKQRPA